MKVHVSSHMFSKPLFSHNFPTLKKRFNSYVHAISCIMRHFLLHPFINFIRHKAILVLIKFIWRLNANTAHIHSIPQKPLKQNNDNDFSF